MSIPIEEFRVAHNEAVGVAMMAFLLYPRGPAKPAPPVPDYIARAGATLIEFEKLDREKWLKMLRERGRDAEMAVMELTRQAAACFTKLLQIASSLSLARGDQLTVEKFIDEMK